MTIKEWTEEWIEVYIKPHRRPKTTKCYEDTLNHLCRNFGDFVETDIDKVTGGHRRTVVYLAAVPGKPIHTHRRIALYSKTAMDTKATAVLLYRADCSIIFSC